MNAPIIDFGAARARRDQGIESSEAHANTDAPGWSDQAGRFLRDFVAEQTKPFTIEQFRAWAYAHGLSQPDEERAFGGVTQRAVRAGLIERIGYAPTSSSNGSAKPLYARPAAPLPSAA